MTLKLSNEVATELVSFIRDVANMEIPAPTKVAAAQPTAESKALAEKIAQQMIDSSLLGVEKKAETVEALCNPALSLRYTKKALDLLVDEQNKAKLAAEKLAADAPAKGRQFSMGRPAASRGAVEKTAKDRLEEANDAFADKVLAAAGRK